MTSTFSCTQLRHFPTRLGGRGSLAALWWRSYERQEPVTKKVFAILPLALLPHRMRVYYPNTDKRMRGSGERVEMRRVALIATRDQPHLAWGREFEPIE